MNKYKYSKRAGALQEAYDEPASSPESSLLSGGIQPSVNVQRNDLDHDREFSALFANHEIESISASEMADEFAPMVQAAAPMMARRRSILPAPGGAPVRAQSIAPAPSKPAPRRDDGLDPLSINRGRTSMFFKTIEDGSRVLMVHKDGTMRVVQGPARVWRIGRRFRPMQHYVAHPHEFLIVRYRDGQQEHLPGPSDVWFDDRTHLGVEKEEALPIASKEAVVVYADEDGAVNRRIVHGPASFVPEPGERLHTFSWHGSRGGKKIPNALQFEKLWLLPDQMYHDVSDVRTADDAVLTIRLMLFFELRDIETMLATTHDPIGDFLNAATSDVVDFVGRHTFETFKQNTEKLNELATYRQIVSRAEEIGYKISRIVYRGYGAPESLQQMHDQAIESRTRLQLEKATEHQSQELEDQKLERQLARSQKLRVEKETEVGSQIRLDKLRHEAEREQRLKSREQERAIAKLDSDLHDARERARHTRETEHLQALQELNVDLTAYLTQARADRVIELRGTESPHVHIGSDD